MTLISIEQAAETGICRLRSPGWSARFAHLFLDVFVVNCRAVPGPRLLFWSPGNLARHGQDPIVMPMSSKDAKRYERYAGPLPGSAAYRQEAEFFKAYLAGLPSR